MAGMVGFEPTNNRIKTDCLRPTWRHPNKNGGDGGLRTHDLCLARAVLSQLSYIPIVIV